MKVHFPPSYERVAWRYQNADTNLVKRTYNELNWEDFLSNNDVKSLVSLFKNTLSNIMSTFVCHESKVFDDKDPPWVSTKVKKSYGCKKK